MGREPYRPRVERLMLLVPTGSAGVVIARGSAVVASEGDGDLLCCDYEGGKHNPSMGWEEKITHAAGRLVERYPTSSRMGLSRDDVIVVGSIEWDRRVGAWVVAELTDPDALYAWRGEATAIGASQDQRRRAAGRILSTRGSGSAAHAMARAHASGTDPIDAVLDCAEAG